jgi:hypothetical protein
MTSTISQQAAAAAAKQILGFYPEIPASDPKGFAAGLVATLSIFPQPVIDRAVDPVQGIPGKVVYLNLAKIRKLLDEWVEEYTDDCRRREMAAMKRLPETPRDPQAERRISEGFEKLSLQLKRGIGPSTQADEGT